MFKKTHKYPHSNITNTQAATDQVKANTLTNTYEQIHNIDIEDTAKHIHINKTV